MRSMGVALLVGLCLTAGMASIAPAAEPVAGKYVVVVIENGDDSWQAIRVHRQTGKSWYARGTDWVPIPGTEDADEGDYHVVAIENPGTIWGAILYDSLSGRSWNLENLTWEEMTEQRSPRRSTGKVEK